MLHLINSRGSNTDDTTWNVVFELTQVTAGVGNFATGSVNWNVRSGHAPRAKICRSAAKELGIDGSQELGCKHILKVSGDLGSKDLAADALKTPSTIKWAMARFGKWYKGMVDVEYKDGQPCVYGGCDKGLQCVGTEDQKWQQFPITAPLPSFFCPACIEKKAMDVA